MGKFDSPHDKLFKAAFSDVKNAAVELRSILPSNLQKLLNLDTLVPVPGSFIDPNLRDSYSDLLFTVQCRKQESLLYILFEHKSQVERFGAVQLLKYMVRIWEMVLSNKPAPRFLPAVIAVLVHHSENGWTATTRFSDLFAPELMAEPELRRLIPDFEILLDDLSHKTDRELRQRKLGAFALLALLFLRDSRRPEWLLEELLKWSDLLQELLQQPEGRHAVLQLLSYLAIVVPELDLHTLVIKVKQASPEASEVVMTLAEQLIEQGRREGKTIGFSDGKIQGFSDGKIQGFSEGQRDLARRMLEKKFGQLPPWACQKLASASEELLENYLDRLVTTSSLTEVLGN